MREPLGDSDFVESVPALAQEQMESKHRLSAKGYGLDNVIETAAAAFRISTDSIMTPGKQPVRVKARSVAAYWAVRLLFIDGTTVGRKLGLRQSAVSRAVPCGEALVKKMALPLEGDSTA